MNAKLNRLAFRGTISALIVVFCLLIFANLLDGQMEEDEIIRWLNPFAWLTIIIITVCSAILTYDGCTAIVRSRSTRLERFVWLFCILCSFPLGGIVWGYRLAKHGPINQT